MKSFYVAVNRLSGRALFFLLLMSVFLVDAKTPLERLVSESGEVEISFDVEQSRMSSTAFSQYVTDYVVFDYDLAVSRQIMQDQPSVIEVTVPTPEGDFTLKLVEQKIVTPDFRAETKSGTEVYYEQVGVHYRGVVEGYEGSLAGASFFDGSMSIIASTRELGNFSANQTVVDGQSRYISYFDKDLLIDADYQCETPESAELPDFLEARYDQPVAAEQQGNEVCIRMHFEVDHGMFLNKGSVVNTIAFVEAVFNNVSLLYANESINVIISYIHVWDTPDDFTEGGSGALADIGEYFTNEQQLNGDLGHLIALDNGLGGIAFLSTICLASPSLSIGYDGVTSSFNDFPVYSWTVLTITHEMGHNLGSPHTHACFWNGNNTQIEDCGPLSGYVEGPCYDPANPIIPAAGGGTIMSYCHLNIGTNLTNGFGLQPGNQIRNTIASCSNLTSCPINFCQTPIQISFANVTETSTTVSWIQDDATDFEVTVTSAEGSDVFVISGNSFLLDELDFGTAYTVSVRAVCEDDFSQAVSASFTTLCNQVFGLPYVETFDDPSWVVRGSINPCWTSVPSSGPTAAQGYEWSVEDFATTSAGADTGPDFDHTTGTGKYIYTEAESGNGISIASIISPSIDLGSANGPLVSFWYHMFGAEIDRLEVEVSTNGGSSWTNLQSIFGQQQTATGDPWIQSILSLSDYEGEVIKLRFKANRGTGPAGDIAVDDVFVTDSSLVDIAVSSMPSPVTGCGLGNSMPVTVMITNSGFQTISSGTEIGLALTLDQTPVSSETLTLAADLEPGSSVSYTFGVTVNLATPSVYDVSVTATIAGDGISDNNTRTNRVNSKPEIVNYPYIQSFEAGSDWVSGGINSSWDLGTPLKNVITGASDGTTAWTTGGLGIETYNADEESYVEGPCFNFSNLEDPFITMDVWWDIEPFWEGAQVQYSTDQGASWSPVGDSTENWYNGAYILTMLPDEGGAGFTGTVQDTDPARPWLTGSGGWVTVTHPLTGLDFEPSVYLRVIFKSDAFVEYDGFAFDNVKVDGTPLSVPCYEVGANATTCNPAEAGTQVLFLQDVTGCDSIVTLVTALLPSYDIVNQSFSCDPDDVGTEVLSFNTVGGCDSTITNVVTLAPSYNIEVSQTTCDENEVGVETLNLSTTFGCDSIVRITTTLEDPIEVSIDATSCDPDDVGTEVLNLSTAEGCDSTVTIVTTLEDPYEVSIAETSCNESLVGTTSETLTASDGCDSIVTTTVSLVPIVADFSYTLNGGTVNFTNNSSNATSYSWTFGDGNTSTFTNPTNSYTTPGSYDVTLTASSPGCADATFTVTIEIVVSSVNQLSFVESVNVFPNPSNGNFAVEIKGGQQARDLTFTLFNVAGTALDSREIGFSSYVKEVYTMSELPDGMYFLRIQSGDEQTTLKVNVLK